jgi:hypothetical protein
MATLEREACEAHALRLAGHCYIKHFTDAMTYRRLQ